jgi:hypothetical protein
MCTIVCCATYTPKSGVPRPKTESIAAPSTSMRIMTPARLKTSAGLLATLAPAARNGSLLAGERFQTTSAVPRTGQIEGHGLSHDTETDEPASIAADRILSGAPRGRLRRRARRPGQC